MGGRVGFININDMSSNDMVDHLPPSVLDISILFLAQGKMECCAVSCSSCGSEIGWRFGQPASPSTTLPFWSSRERERERERERKREAVF